MRPILYPIPSFLPLQSLHQAVFLGERKDRKVDLEVEFCGKIGRWRRSFVERQNTNCKISMAHCPLSCTSLLAGGEAAWFDQKLNYKGLFLI